MAEAKQTQIRMLKLLYVSVLTLVMLGLIGFGYTFDQSHSYAARTAQETSAQTPA